MSLPSETGSTVPHRISRAGQVWLIVLSIGTVFSLFGAVLGIIRYGELEKQRNEDRIEFDAGSCQRGNDNRKLNKEIAMAGAELDREILDLLITNEETQARIDERLAPAFAKYEALVNEIKQVDCKALLEETAPQSLIRMSVVRTLAADR